MGGTLVAATDCGSGNRTNCAASAPAGTASSLRQPRAPRTSTAVAYTVSARPAASTTVPATAKGVSPALVRWAGAMPSPAPAVTASRLGGLIDPHRERGPAWLGHTAVSGHLQHAVGIAGGHGA